MKYVEGWFIRTLIAALAQGTALFALRPLVAYRALELGASPAQVGVIAGAYAALSLLFAMPAGRLVDRYGEQPMLLSGTGLVAIASVSLLWADSLPALAAAQSLLGLGSLNLTIGVQALFGNAGDPAGRDARYGGMAITGSLGQILGPLVVALFVETSDAIGREVYLAVIALTVIAVLMAATVWIKQPSRNERRDAPERTAAPPADGDSGRLAVFRTVLRIRGIPQAMFVSLSVLTGIDVITTYLPVYGESRGISVTVVTTLLSIRAAASLASRVAMLPMIRLLGRQRLLAVSVLLPAIGLAGVATTINPVLLGILLAIAGFGLGLGQPMTISWVASQAPVGIRGSALGLRLTGNTLAQATMPAFVGLIATATGIGAVFVFVAMLLATGAGLLRGVDLTDRQPS